MVGEVPVDSDKGKEIQVCNHCNEEFEPQRPDREYKYCSRSCASSKKYCAFQLEKQNYPGWSVSSVNFPVHRLLVIADGADPEKVFSGNYHVHHKNGCRLDNRPGNLELMVAEEHMEETVGYSLKEFGTEEKLEIVQRFYEELDINPREALEIANV